MHMPSERVHKEMRSEAASLWVVPANDGREIAILIKAPTPSIKALLEGCSAEIIFGLKDSYLCSGIRIFDIPDAALFISGAVRHEEEHQAIEQFLEARSSPVFLFNEMDVCVAWSNVSVTDSDSDRAKKLLGDIEALYVGSFDNACSLSLDCFDYSTDKTRTCPNAVEIPFSTISLSIEPWRINNNTFIGFRESHSVVLNEPEEGEIFERAIWASLESVFPLTLYKSPQVKIGEKTRELTDVLAFYQYGSFLIEAKDLSILRMGLDRSLERRVLGVQKQAKKAIGQLVGAYKAIARGDAIFDAEGNELNIERENAPHCIVLVTELHHSGDWSEVENLLIDAIQSTGAFFNLLDFRELITLLKGSSGKPELFDYNLLERCKAFVECKSVHIRSQAAPKKCLADRRVR